LVDDCEVEGSVFVNILFVAVMIMCGWIEVLCLFGYVVFVKFKIYVDDDVDFDMFVYIVDCVCIYWLVWFVI